MTTSHVSLPDYSEYLAIPAHLENEEREWGLHEAYKLNADTLKRVMDQWNYHDVLEVGCGSGWIPLRLQISPADYVGVDNNDGCLTLAHRKNPGVPFIKCDVRTLPQNYTADIVCAFAFLKHFGLHEWDAVVKSILRRGKSALFTMQTAETDFDDGVEYPHTWVTLEHLKRVVNDAGHEVVEVLNLREAEKGEEWTFHTRRK